MRESILAMALLFSCLASHAATAAWPQKARDARHSYFSTAPSIAAPGVFWVIDDVPVDAQGTPCTVIGANNDIYCVRYNGTMYSIVELNRKGQTVRTYLASGSAPITSLALSSTNLYATWAGQLHAWVLGDTNISWSKTDDYIESVVLLDDAGNVYVGSANKLYSLDPAGVERWVYNLVDLMAPPVYYGGAVYVAHGSLMTAINASNKSKRWERDIKYWGTDWDFFAMPIIGPDGTIWAARVAYGIIQDHITFDPNTGASTLGATLPYYASIYGVTNSRMLLLFGSRHVLGATYNTSVPEIVENFDANIGYTPSSLFTMATDTIYTGRSNGTLYGYRTSNGSQKWAFPLNLSGAYPVNLMAADQYGTLYVPLSNGRLAAVGEAPVAVATGPSSAGLGVPVTFSSAGSGPGIPTDTYTIDWDFGDGTPHSSEANPTHAFTVDGRYNVVLTITVNETGAVATDTIPFTADGTAPTVTLARALLKGTMEDNMYPPPNITVAGATVPVDPVLHTWQSGEITLETSGPTDIDIIATDASSNTARVILTISP